MATASKSEHPEPRPDDVEFLIITALEEEFYSVSRAFDLNSYHHETLDKYCKIALNDRVTIKGKISKTYDVGRTDAAVTTTMNLLYHHPKLVLLVGIAGGFRSNAADSVNLGDVIIGQPIIDIDHRKVLNNRTIFRKKVHVASPRLLLSLENFQDEMNKQERAAKGHRFYDTPRIRIGVVLSTSRVIAKSSGREKFFYKNIRLEKTQEPLAVEMEAVGVLTAIQRLGSNARFLMIKGVSDYADENKNKDEETWRLRACDNAAHVAREYVNFYFRTRQMP